MAKLDERRVQWIVREMEKGTRVSRITWARQVDRRRKNEVVPTVQGDV